MSALYRFGVSLDKELIGAFDKHIKQRNYRNRSEAIRDLIRDELLRKSWQEKAQVSGAIVMTYDHHKRELVTTLLDIAHDFQKTIISTQHVHLNHHDCLEIIAVSGPATQIQQLASRLKALVGVKNLSLSICAATQSPESPTKRPHAH